MRIAVCAPSTPIMPEDAARVAAVVRTYPGLTLDFHPQCFAVAGHFAGEDALRLAALVECANDAGVDAVWFARGGYGAGRIVAAALAQLGPAAQSKRWLGYSDAGMLLAAFYRARVGQPVHAPMPVDIRRAGGERAVRRVLGWLAGDRSGEDAGLDGPAPVVAFNLTILAMLLASGTAPDLAGHVVLVEEVSEYDYAVDRLLGAVTAGLARVGAAGLRLGRVSDVPANDRPFGETPEAMAERWCATHGLAWLGRADIGHDAENRIVPFGLASPAPRA